MLFCPFTANGSVKTAKILSVSVKNTHWILLKLTQVAVRMLREVDEAYRNLPVSARALFTRHHALRLRIGLKPAARQPGEKEASETQRVRRRSG